jgi:hypothetical protein
MSKKSVTFAVQSESKGDWMKNILKKCDKNFAVSKNCNTFASVKNIKKK